MISPILSSGERGWRASNAAAWYNEAGIFQRDFFETFATHKSDKFSGGNDRAGMAGDERELRRTGQSIVPLVVALIVILAVMFYLSRRPAPPAPGVVPDHTARVGPADIYPRADLTPGSANPDVTQENIGQTICNPHWSTRSIRPPEQYTNRLKHEQLGEYGDTDTAMRDYEEDHLIPLELGGHPSDPKNLWPEAYATSISDGGARDKDKVENYLHDQVCGGRVGLRDAQNQIATDWYRVYVSIR